jgi:hypothetical protein
MAGPSRKVDELPVVREPGRARGLEEIRGRADKQLHTGKKAHISSGKGSNNVRKAYDRRRHLKRRIEKEIDEQASALAELDKEVVKREEILALKEKAPSVKQMRAATAALFKEYDLSPIKELIKLAKRRGPHALPPKEKAAILRYVAEYEAPKPKSVDIQADIDSNVSVALVDFRNTGAEVMKMAAAAQDEDYDEFEQEEG